MAYSIRYVSFGEEKKQPKNQKWHKKWIAASLILLLVVGAMAVKLGGLPWITDYLLPGDPAVTAAALEDMVTDLKEGDNLYDAVRSFCREIMDHGSKDQD